MKNGENPPCDARIPGGWPELATLWALEDDSRHRERLLIEHSLLMKVVERKALEAFCRALSDSRSDLRFHLADGIGYDLERLQCEIETVWENPIGIEPFYAQALEALGDARRTIRQGKDGATRRQACQQLLRAAESLYDRAESLIAMEERRRFIMDGLRKTEAWLDRNDDPNGKVAAQKTRLLRARQRLERALGGLPQSGDSEAV